MGRAMMLTPAEHAALDEACWPILKAFGRPAYLVGSALTNPQYRDVDVRVIIRDSRFAKLFPKCPDNPWQHPLFLLVCGSVSARLSQQTGLRVDFQVQSQTMANAFDGQRSALGIFPVRSG